MGFTLKILEGPEEGKSFSFDRIEITIGRTMENDVVLPDPGISRQHMSIRDKGGAYIIKDLGSSNGTMLNGKQILEEVIRTGDVITLGGARVQFEGGPKAQGSKSEKRTTSRARPARAGRARVRSRTPRRRVGDKHRGSTRPARERTAGKRQRPVIRSPGMRQQDQPAEPAGDQPVAREGSSRSQHPGARGKVGIAVAKFKHWFRGLDKRLQIALIAVAAVLFILVVLKLFQGGREFVRQSIDHSDEEFFAGEYGSDGEPMSYGMGPVSMRCRDRATFRFKYANGRSTVTYSVAGVDSKQEVEIQLNGIHVGYAPITLDRWSDYMRLTLPRKHLLENEENRITFVNTVNYNNSNAKERWAVEVASIEETPLPSPDRDAALEAFQIAKDRYKTRDVSPPNLYHALENFKKTRDFLELLPDGTRPDIYHEASEMVVKLEKELDDKIRNLMFTAEQHNEFKRYEQAKETYRQVLLTIPRTDDPRHISARRKFEEFE